MRWFRFSNSGSNFLQKEISVDAAWLLIHRPPGSGQLQTLAALDQPEAKFDAWKRDPTKFPHFTAFVGFLIYSLYDAEKNQNSPLDRNWQGDAEQLCFLVDVDAMVSSDLRFMKGAFEALGNPARNTCSLLKNLSPFSRNSKGEGFRIKRSKNFKGDSNRADYPLYRQAGLE
jgi:hypothetical protein